MRSEPTDTLVRRFLNSPGIESDQLDFKAKDKIVDNDGRRDVVKDLVGMANKWGGTIIIGVKEEGDPQVQSFSEDSEIKRDLTNMIRDNTEPDLSGNVNIDFDRVSGKHVLRVEVKQTDYELYKFNDLDQEGNIPYWRDEDNTVEMTPDDCLKFAEYHQCGSDPMGQSQTERIRKLPRLHTPTVEASSPDHRIVSESSESVQPIFGVQPLFRNKPIVFELESQLRIQTIEEAENLLDRAYEYLNVSPNSVVYSIHQGTRVWCGRGDEQLKSDLEQINSVVEQMLGGHPREVDDDITHLDDIRATISITAGCYLGRFHAELYWKYGSLHEARAGTRLEDLPFDDEFLHDFFSKYRGSPTVYDQQRNAQNRFTLFANIELQNCIPVDFRRESQFTSYVVADNPFYQQHTEIQRQADEPLPKLPLRNFCSIKRILFRIKEGTTDPELKNFRMKKITVWPTDYLYSPYYIEAECSGYLDDSA